ncbi:hypothetical protein N7491_011173 [Penicillium cf. griseofulvum]|uniref:Uncharacterized protein n=1 Tax=Penicillium cf. griseofulvum TaxID=2972120 RepID=A0A9W9T6H5_9EURO|nr:hypothetical protein N7472_001492 [Penicillium cf. griseofulvum]KAJ5422728.1 hypothetical protein N7491_011173 [Penicillium cf. griseofulvum]KAJ5428904.1 hypothetical protein N7445_010358 [Penicillium cf. griseofulvum]
MNITMNTGEITTSMGKLALTNTKYPVYLVKREITSHPEGGSAIFVRTSESAGNIHFIESEGARHVAVQAHEIGEILMPIGTTFAQEYHGWDEVLVQLHFLLAKEPDQQDMLTLLASPLKVSQWTQLARLTLKSAGLLEEVEAAAALWEKVEADAGLLEKLEAPQITFNVEVEMVQG